MSNFDYKEIARLRKLLAKIVELAEHIEQTGSFESGMTQLVQRYNGIVEHLEEIEAIPEDLFPKMNDRADSGQLGIETSLLADYLSDLTGDGPASTMPPPDLGSLVALAPFLESKELSKLVRERFSANPPEPAKDETASVSVKDEAGSSAPAPPDMKTILLLAPHLKQGDLQDMTRTYLARQGQITPQQIAQLAPFLDGDLLGDLMRTYMPGWFGDAPPPPPSPVPPAPPVPPAAPSAPAPPAWEAAGRPAGTSLQARQGTPDWEEAPEPPYITPRIER